AILERLLAAARALRFLDERSVGEEVRGVRREIDRDDRSAARRLRRQSFDAIVAMQLPPVTVGLCRSGDYGEQSYRHETAEYGLHHLEITVRNWRQQRGSGIRSRDRGVNSAKLSF